MTEQTKDPILERLETDLARLQNTLAMLRHRIRPEPRRIWVNEYPSGLFRAHSSKEAADVNAGANRTRVVKFIEVLE